MPDDALYYAALGCVECGRHETGKDRTYRETTPLQERLEHGQQAKKAREDRRDLIGERKELEAFERRYGRLARPHRPRR